MTSRADFVMHLGRHAGELKGVLARLEATPDDAALRDDLRGRIGALAATARTLALVEVNDRLALAHRALEGPAPPGPAALLRLRALLDDLPSLAWSDASLKTPYVGAARPSPREAPPPVEPRPSPGPAARGPAPAAARPPGPPPPARPSGPARPFEPPPRASARAPEPPPSRVPGRPPEPPPSRGAARPPEPPGAARPATVSEPDAEATIPSEVTWPTTALVVGGLSLTNALTVGDVGSTRVPLEWERCDKPDGALDLARALAPDVVLLDGDLPGADEFARRLGADALTEPVPLVVVGHFRTPDDAARWLALGAFQVLPRPASPDAVRNAVLAAVAAPHRPTRPEPVGERSLDALAAMLAEELRQGLLGSASDTGRAVKVPVGDGHEVRAALWAAIARIRDVITIRTGGAVRFSGGPEGALPLASWLTDSRAPGSRAEPGAAEAEVSGSELKGRRVLVVDDDPAVRWFLLGLFRAAGAEAFEATDGNAAFALACRTHPDLVVSDVIMPGRDGFALCRSIKRDLVLRDAAVILLSWKEDLLQRMRELGASADGYLRKEANASVVLARAREVLRPRARLEARLPGEGEVRGRLDGLTVRTLLTLVARHRPDARVSVRDASYLYEVDVRDGAPRRATRTASDGAFERGARVMAGLIGVGAGRFVVTSSLGTSNAGRGDLRGSLDEQLFDPVCRARAAQRLLSESGLLNVKRVGVDLGAVEAYLQATPEPMRAHVRAIAEGTPPRALVLKGLVSAALLERLLDDVIAHGGLNEIVGTLDEDLLAPAVDYERAVLRAPSSGPGAAPGPAPGPALREQGVVPLDLYTPSPLGLLPSPPPPVAAAPEVLPPSQPNALQPGHVVDVGTARPAGVVEVTTPLLVAPPPPVAPRPPEGPAAGPAGPSAAPGGQTAPPPALAGQAAPYTAPGVQNPYPAPDPASTGAYGQPPPYGAAPSRAPQAPGRVGAGPSGAPRIPPPPPPRSPMATPSRLYAAPAPAAETPRPSGGSASAQAAAAIAAARAADTVRPPPVAYPDAEPERARSPGRTLASWALAGLVLAGVGGGFWWYALGRPGAVALTMPIVATPVVTTPAVSSAPPVASETTAPAARAGDPAPSAATAPEAAPASATSSGGAVEAPPAGSGAAPATAEGEDGPLPPGALVPEGYGLLEIKVPAKSELFVDRLNMGVGPQLSLPLPAGAHDVRLRSGDQERPLAVTIRPGRRTALDLRTAWPAR